jgi:GT2 family glycosyltransferase
MSGDQPEVKVVLLNWNSYDDTAECIESLYDIEYGNSDITVVDNDSDDNSLEKLCSDYPEPSYIKAEENYGFSAGNNLGIRHALEQGADYVLLLNNDTEVEQGFLTKLVETAEQKRNAGIVTSKILVAGTDPPRIWCAGGELDFLHGKGVYRGHEGADRGEVDEGQYDTTERVGMASGCVMLVPVEVFEDVGLLSEEYFFGGEEWDFSARVCSHRYDIWYEPDAVVHHKVSKSIDQSFNNPWQIYNRERSRLLFQQNNLSKAKYFAWYLLHWGFKLTIGLSKQWENAEEHPELSFFDFLKINSRAERDHLTSGRISKPQLSAVERQFGGQSPWD